jgi:adenine phosphoribosyltransferase
MTANAAPMQATAIVAVESRGFLFGAPMALSLGLPLVPVRKPGKLPAERIGIDYGLEYGRDRLELHSDAISHGDRVLLIDDVLATGGTVKAAAALVRQLGGDVVGAHFLIAISDLDGAAALAADAIPCHALITQ